MLCKTQHVRNILSMFCLICCLMGFFKIKNLFFKIPNTHSISFLVLSTEVDQFPIGPAGCCLQGQARHGHSWYPPSQRSQAPWFRICLPCSSTHVHSIVDSGWPAWEPEPCSMSNTSSTRAIFLSFVHPQNACETCRMRFWWSQTHSKAKVVFPSFPVQLWNMSAGQRSHTTCTQSIEPAHPG